VLALSNPRFLLPFFLLLSIVAVVLLLQFDPNVAGNPLPPCPFHWLTGLHCPGCGATRALHALLHGDIAKAFSMNALFVSALPVVILLIANHLAKLPAGAAKLAAVFNDARCWAVILIGFGVLRNLPWYPFNLLAPG
jgi:hypothetical protein